MNDRLSLEGLAPAIDAVSAACGAARSVQRDLDRVRQFTKDDRSPVTVADFAVQAIVALALRDACGDALIVGEEHAGVLREARHSAVADAVIDAVRAIRPDADGAAVLDAIDACDHDGSADAYWTLDPIDGTKGFLRGQQYAIALGRIERGRVTQGVMGCPNLPAEPGRPLDTADPRGSIYAAAEGCGAWHWPGTGTAGRPAPVRARRQPGAVIRICESVESAHSSHSDTSRLVEHLGLPVDYDRLDSQCKYALVARGQSDAYLRMPTRRDYAEAIWDHAAGSIIATEAGAVVSDITGLTLQFTHGRRLAANRGVICAASGIHGRIIDAIAALGIATAV